MFRDSLESRVVSRECCSRGASSNSRPARSAKGQTLIELLIAMTVIMIGLTAAAALVISNIRLQEISADRVIATNLAREGIEMAKAQRDSNWLAGGAFNAGMSVGSGVTSDYSAIPSVGSSGVFGGFDFTPNNIDTDTNYTKIVRSTTAASLGMYIQGFESGAPVVGTSTPFLRLLQFGPICADGKIIGVNGTDCTGHGLIAGVHVTSTVKWTKRGTARQSVIVDDLYDWR
jgi:Tfp pilus assembly protein PilV